MFRFLGRVLTRILFRILIIAVFLMVAFFIFKNFFGDEADVYTEEEKSISSSEAVTESKSNFDSPEYISYFETIDEEDTYLGFINCKRLNIREGPGSDYGIVGVQVIDDVSLVHGQCNGWYYIYLEGEAFEGNGWVFSDLLDVYRYNNESEELYEFEVKD